MPLNLTINRETIQTIGQSFDRIAHELIHQYALNLQGTLYTFTEIEFYYFDKASHPDKYSHKHSYERGKWRFHLQGLDISLGHETEHAEHASYGGILLRGIKTGERYINGPKRILSHIFESLGNTELIYKEFGIVPLNNPGIQIYKSFRKGLSDRYPEFNDLTYRYYHCIEHWNDLHVSPSEKRGIISHSVKL